MNSSYEQKHPLYAASFTKRRKAMDLYEGGERIEGNRAYLTRHTYESDKQYDIRASRATYRNFAAPIVDVFASFINEGRPERILPDALRPIEADADRYGMTADAFFADVTRLAAAGGARFVIVDMEQKKGGNRGGGTGPAVAVWCPTSPPSAPTTCGTGGWTPRASRGRSSTAKRWSTPQPSPPRSVTKP